MMNIRTITSAGYDFWSDCPTVSGSGGIGYGSVEIEYGWQLLAVPIQYGYWSSATHEHVHDGITVARFKNYILDQIEDLYGTDKVEVSNTYSGDNQFFWSYVVGTTPESSPHNWQLMYDDGVHREISGFWLKSLSVSPMVITWGEIE
jgi:hypothetical protein